METPRTCTYCGEERTGCRVNKSFVWVSGDPVKFNMCPDCQDRYGQLTDRETVVRGTWSHKRQELAFTDDINYMGVSYTPVSR